MPDKSGHYLSPDPPHPLSYLGALLSTRGGDCTPSSTVIQSPPATDSAAIVLHQMACRRKRPRCRPGCRNVPRAPNPPDEATPSHPQPTMGGILRQRQLSCWRERTIGLLVRTSRRCKSSRRQRLTSRPLSRSISWLADTNGLVAALVIATYLRRPIRQTRPLPPTLNQQWGGLLCRRQLSCRRERTIGILVRINLPPSNPSPLKVPLQLTRGGIQ